MNTTLGQMSSSISLPPISAINFEHNQHGHGHGHATPQELSQHAIPAPARTLPPLPYYSSMQAMPQPEYVQPARPMYAGVQTPYGMHMRMPLPSSGDAAGMIGYAPSRHTQKTKDVKRRTKTGCMTCRKRRIKVSSSNFLHQAGADPHASCTTNGGTSARRTSWLTVDRKSFWRAARSLIEPRLANLKKNGRLIGYGLEPDHASAIPTPCLL